MMVRMAWLHHLTDVLTHAHELENRLKRPGECIVAMN